MSTCEGIFSLSRSRAAIKFFNDAYYLNEFVEVLGCLSGHHATLEPVLDDEKTEEILNKAKFCRGRQAWLKDEHCQSMCSSFPIINENAFSGMMRPVQVAWTYSGVYMHLAEDLEPETGYVRDFEEKIVNIARLDIHKEVDTGGLINTNNEIQNGKDANTDIRLGDKPNQNEMIVNNDFKEIQTKAEGKLIWEGKRGRQDWGGLEFENGFRYFIEHKGGELMRIEKTRWDPYYGKGWNLLKTPIKEFTLSGIGVFQSSWILGLLLAVGLFRA